MRDLDIGRRLAGAVTPEEVRSLGDRPLAGRAPYLAGLVALIDHADPALRAAALCALAGARGVPGLRAIVARLDEADPVRDAALAALRAAARDAPARYAHALFHPRAEVRRAALAN